MLRPDGLVKVLDFGLAKLASNDSYSGWRRRRRTSRLQDRCLALPPTCRRSRRAACRSMGQPMPGRLASSRMRWSRDARRLLARRRATSLRPFSNAIRAAAAARPGGAGSWSGSSANRCARIRAALSSDEGSAARFLEALRDETATRATPGLRDDSPPPRPPGRSKRAAMLAAVAALVLAVGGGAWWYGQRASPAPPVSGASATPVARPLTRLTFDEGLQTDVHVSPDGRSIAYACQTGPETSTSAFRPSTAASRANSPTRRRRQQRSPPGRRMGKRLCSAPNAIAVDCSSPMPTEARSVKLSSFGVNPVWSPEGIGNSV